MATPTPTTIPNPYASILNDPFYTSLFGDTGGMYSSILNDPSFNSLVSSMLSGYGLDSYYYPTATYNPYATGAGATTPAAAGTAGSNSNSNPGAADASQSTSKSGAPIGAIVGGVVGGVVVLALVGVLIFCLRRRKRRNEMSERDFFIDDMQPVQAFPLQSAYVAQAPLQPGWQQPMSQTHASLTKGSHDSQSPFLAPVLPLASHPSRTSFSSSADPSTSQSATVTSDDEKHRVGRSDKSSSLAASHFSPPTSTAHPHSHATSSRAPSSWAGDTVIEHAVDAGSIQFPPAPRQEVLPPMYDPNWSASGPAQGS